MVYCKAFFYHLAGDTSIMTAVDDRFGDIYLIFREISLNISCELSPDQD